MGTSTGMRIRRSPSWHLFALHKCYPLDKNLRVEDCSVVFLHLSLALFLRTQPRTVPPVPWFAVVQCVEGKNSLGCLTPKTGFVTAQPVQRVARQVSEAQKALGELRGAVVRRP